jgi:DNA-directed RNA polymerase alpha subunit
VVKKTDAGLLKARSFGKTSLREARRKMDDMGLSLGMDVANLATVAAGADTEGDGENAGGGGE